MYIRDEFEDIDKFKHVFHKGSSELSNTNDGTHSGVRLVYIYIQGQTRNF